MSAPYGPHLINGAGPHLTDLVRLDPSAATFLDPNKDDVAAFRRVCPRTICIGRIYVPDSEVESRICADPEAAAAWAHGLVMQHPARGLIDYWQIPNEVCQFADKLPLINRFFVKWMQLADGGGYKCAVFGWSVGQIDMPANDRMALWRMVYPTCAYAEAHEHIGLVHGYGAPTLWEPAAKGGAPWLINRLEVQVLPLLPYKKLRFVYGEYGIDGLLLDPALRSADMDELGVGVSIPAKDLTDAQPRAFNAPAGWQRYTDAAGYVKQLTDMGQWLAQFSSRVLGYCIFTLGHNAPWGSYDIQGDVLRGLADYYSNGQPPVDPNYATLAEAIKGEAEKHDVLPIAPGTALLKAAYPHGLPALLPTSDEYPVSFGGVNYVAQRFRNPASDAVTALYCVKGKYDKVKRQDWQGTSKLLRRPAPVPRWHAAVYGAPKPGLPDKSTELKVQEFTMTTGEQFDQTMLEAWSANVKAMFEQHLRDTDREREQVNDWHAFGLEQARNNAQVINRLAQENATLGTRIANNHATFDSLIFAGEIDTTAQGALGAKTAEEFRSVAKSAIESAMATSAMTTPPAQGSTGVANSGLQTQVPIEMAQVLVGSINVQTALLTQLAKLTSIVDVLVVKVLGEEVVTEA